MKKLISFAFIGLFVLILGACSTNSTYSGSNYSNKQKQTDILKASHKAAFELIKKSSGALSPHKPLIAASFSNINNLDKSSTFGRIVPQQLATAFSSAGYNMTEMLLRGNIYIKQGEGEFLLSRSLKNISLEHNIQAVIVGTYAIGKDNLFVTAKIINAESSSIIASHDYVLPIDRDLRTLLK